MLVDIILVAVLLLTLDFVYLGLTKSMLLPVFETIQCGSPLVFRYEAAVACYLLLTLGHYYFVIRENRPWWEAFWMGVFVYGVYDTTTLAVFKKYTIQMAAMDTLWGGILFASTAELYKRVRPLLGRR
jgi:uncharacterized membrane protein